MKKNILFIAYSFFSFFVNGQEVSEKDKFNLIMLAGLSTPLGNYSNKSISNANAGFAKTGYTGNISIQYHIFKNHYFVANISSHSNKFDGGSLANQLNAQTPNYLYTSTSNNWQTLSFLLGACDIYNLNKQKTLFLINRAFLGYANVHSPSIYITKAPIGTGVSSWTRQSDASAGSFAWSIDLGIKKRLQKNYSIFFLVNYFNTKPTFNNVTTTNSSGSISQYSFRQSISSLEFMGGVSFDFYYKKSKK